LENAFILAKDTGRSEEFERPSTPVTILYKKLPHLVDRWAEQKAKQSLKTGTMVITNLFKISWNG
jgi:hypothetical protein